jgi:hypothetical protein
MKTLTLTEQQLKWLRDAAADNLVELRAHSMDKDYELKIQTAKEVVTIINKKLFN